MSINIGRFSFTHTHVLNLIGLICLLIIPWRESSGVVLNISLVIGCIAVFIVLVEEHHKKHGTILSYKIIPPIGGMILLGIVPFFTSGWTTVFMCLVGLPFVLLGVKYELDSKKTKEIRKVL